MYPQPPSRDALQAALHAFIEIYARRHLDLYERRRRGSISAEEFSTASRRLTAIQAHIQAYWLNTPFVLPPEYNFDPWELSDLIQAEIAGCQQVQDDSIEILSGQEALVEALGLIDALLTPTTPEDLDNLHLFF